MNSIDFQAGSKCNCRSRCGGLVYQLLLFDVGSICCNRVNRKSVSNIEETDSKFPIHILLHSAMRSVSVDSYRYGCL